MEKKNYDKERTIKIKKVVRYIVLYIILPFFLDFVVESFSRKSIFGAFAYIAKSPLLFFFNFLIIMLTLSVSMFFKREIFVLLLISIVWMLFGIVNFILLHFRVTPFSAVDFSLISSALKVSSHYFGVFQIAMILTGVVTIIVAVIALFKKAPKHKTYTHRRLMAAVIFFATVGVSIVVMSKYNKSVKSLKEDYTNIAEAYENYGFAYTFTNSIIDTGITKPDDYGEEKVRGIVDSIKNVKNSSERPNIIIVQLESFFDVDYLNDLEYSKDPLPNFHQLKEKFGGGLITVPTVGAGTVNTEFEVLTGLSQHDFGTSQYPYKTILKKETCESICYDLKKLGYTTHAVHNNEANFYGRQEVYKNLGFDSFTSMEYMNGLKNTPNGWCKDEILTGEIIKTLDKTEGPDFTMAITVQSHGKYDGIADEGDYPIKLTKTPKGKEDSYAYFVNEIHEVDEMIGALVKELEKRDEKTVMVLYGDHLPSLDIKEEDLRNHSLYDTEYVIWNNMNLERHTTNVTSYELYPYVLDMIGIHDGIITGFQQQNSRYGDTYSDRLKTLAYDMLYGERYATGGVEVYEPSDLNMGIDDIYIKDIKKVEAGYLVQGENFTKNCKLYFDDEDTDVEFISPNSMLIEKNFKPFLDIETGEEHLFTLKVEDDDGLELSDEDAINWSEITLSDENPAF